MDDTMDDEQRDAGNPHMKNLEHAHYIPVLAHAAVVQLLCQLLDHVIAVYGELAPNATPGGHPPLGGRLTRLLLYA
jgi:hypothetical protein